MIPEMIRALINKKHGKKITYANLYDEILEIAKAAREDGYNKGLYKTSDITGIPAKNIRWRLKNGWSIERALTQPIQKHTPPRKYKLIENNPFSRIKI